MEVIGYTSEMAPEVTASYNEIIRGVPHCYPASAEELAAAVSATAGEHSDKPLHSKAAFVAREGASVLGFIDVGIGWPDEGADAEQGVIQFYWYQRGHREAGQALLTRAEQHLRERNPSQVEAFPQEYRYPFYHLESACLSDRLDQVAAILGINGYRRVRGEVWPAPVDGTSSYVSPAAQAVLPDLDPAAMRVFQAKTASSCWSRIAADAAIEARRNSSGAALPSALCGRSAL